MLAQNPAPRKAQYERASPQWPTHATSGYSVSRGVGLDPRVKHSNAAGLFEVTGKKAACLCTPLAYNKSMEFIESHIFEKQVNALLSDDEFALFQGFLFSNPRAGAVIQQTGGLRKVRWAVQGKGKSGGVRMIYFCVTAAAQIRLIAIYKKGIKDDLSAAEKKIL